MIRPDMRRRLLTNLEVQPFLVYATAAILGLVVFHVLFDLPVYIQYRWGLDKPSDLMQHIAGFYALRSAPWQMPLLYTNILGWPEGVNVYFTDSIPFLALLFKWFSPILPADFHYFKIWVVVSFMLQPIAAVHLIRSLGYRQPGAAFFAAAFSLLIKWLIFRTGHPALCGQFVILFAIALYVQQTRSLRTGLSLRSLSIRWLCLIGFTFLIHLYLFVMVVAIFAAAVLDFRFDKIPPIRLLLYKANLLLMPCLLFLILYAVLIGPNRFTDLPAADGYGYFSLNLTGPIFGGNLITLPKTLGPSIGQVYEDQSYLGLGLILLLLLAVVLDRKTLFETVRKHPFLLLLLLAFYIFALSTDIYLGHTLYYRYPGDLTTRIRESSISQFRASARFFWPVGYVLLFYSLAVLLKRRWALPVLACLLVIQWVDLPKPYTPRPEGYRDAVNVDFPFWDHLLQGKRAVYLYPTLSCGGDAYRMNIPILLIAAKNGVISNTVFVTRYQEDCDDKLTAALDDISPNTVHILPRPQTNKQAQYVLDAFPQNWCASRQELIICVAEPTAADLELLQQVDRLMLINQSPLNYP